MHPILALSALPLNKHPFINKSSATNRNDDNPTSKPITTVSNTTPDPATIATHMAISTPLTQHQAHALKTLTFGGKTMSSAPKLESDFIRILRTSKDNTEKAGVAEILGRAKSVNAIPHLLKLLDAKEDVEVRTAAAGALASIGSSTHKNSFTATELSDALMESYQQRRTAMAEHSESTVELSYEDKLDETENREKMLTELKTLANGVSQLNVVAGKKALHEEYLKTLELTQMSEETVNEMTRLTELAQDQFHQELSKRFQKPVKQLLKEIPKAELDEMKKKVIIKMPDGKSINLLEALQHILMMQEQHEQFNCQLLLGLMDALSLHNERENNTAIKLAIDSNHAGIKARSLEILSDRNMLNYSSDIYPNLSSRDEEVRAASVKALLASPESAAKQKTLELMVPDTFFNIMGGMSLDGMGQYVNFLRDIAIKGDDHVQALCNQALHSEYDVESRQIALMTLSMMLHEPINKGLMPQTIMQAASTIKIMALSPPARKPDEHDALSLMATLLWVETEDPTAIPAAIMMADSKEHRLSGKDQERLLSSVLKVLHKDALSQNKDSEQTEQIHTVLDILKSNHDSLLTSEAEAKLEHSLKPNLVTSRVNPNSVDEFLEENEDLDIDAPLAKQLEPALDELRPALKRLAESDKSNLAQMVACRIMGLLKDTDSIKYLVSRVRDPLKGKLDWDADVSYKGNPSMTAANMRLNALTALGDIGDARALDVMTDTLDDPVLKAYVTKPLGKIAKDANAKANETKLAKVRNKLVHLMESPNTTRAMRATRINAANTLYKFNGGIDALKDFAAKTPDPNFKRHALSALLSNNYATETDHPDHDLVKKLIYPGLGVERLHAQGITGKGVELAIVDGGYVDGSNEEGFQNRVKLPAEFDKPEHYHPTMVMSTAAANGKLKGVAPDATVYSDMWPDFEGKDPMDVYKKIIEGKLRGENNVRVINNSWGFSDQNGIIHKDIRTILKEFKNVVDMAEKAGIQIVFAAGNEGEEPGFPKLGTLSLFGVDVDKLTAEDKKLRDYILDKVILVGAVNTQGSDKRTDHMLAEFSSVGDSLNKKITPTVIAPGVDMMVYSWDKHQGNPKELVNGTSFASPYVTGLIALMVQANPKLTPADIRDILKKSSVKLGGVPASQQGHGEVSPENAIKMAQTYYKAPARARSDSTDRGNITTPPQLPSQSRDKKAPKPKDFDGSHARLEVDTEDHTPQPVVALRPHAPDDKSPLMNEVKGISTRIMGRKRTTSNVENNDPDALSVLNQAKQLGVESGKKPKLEHTAVHFGSNRQVQQPKGDRISFEGKALSFKLPSKPSKPSLSRVPSGLPRINPPNDPSLEIIR
jgi:serine protease AprX